MPTSLKQVKLRILKYYKSFSSSSQAFACHADKRDPLEQPFEEFAYVDIDNSDTKWGVLNPTKMIGRDAESSRIRRIMYVRTILVSTTRPTRNAIGIVPKDLDNQICSSRC